MAYQNKMNMVDFFSLENNMEKNDGDDERLGHHDGRPLSKLVAVPSSPLS